MEYLSRTGFLVTRLMQLIKRLCALALEEFTDRYENRGSPCAKAYGRIGERPSG
jgi:hypothetical protein